MVGLESAIPKDLRQERTCPMAMKKNWQPPYPSYSARFDSTQTALTMLILGVQFPDRADAREESQSCTEGFMAEAAEHGDVLFRDQSEFLDGAGLTNRMIVCYLGEDAEEAVAGLRERWLAAAGAGAVADGRAGWGGDRAEWGFYVEEIRPTMDRIETLYSSDHIQGVGNVAESLSAEIQEHGYWGSARDRMPAAQQNQLAPEGGVTEQAGDVVIVRDVENLCLIRSGQDWSETSGDERAMYLEEVEPTLRAGMDFLSTEGAEVGCIANRYARVLGDDGTAMDQSYGMSWWRSMTDLDDWARAHPTHKAIFGVAMRYLGEHGGSGHLKLTHEVFVLARGQGHFVYRNCHPATGLLGLEQ